MKKLTLKTSNLKNGEMLTTAEMKNVMGGLYDAGSGDCDNECESDSDCSTGKKCTSSVDIGGACDGLTRKYCL